MKRKFGDMKQVNTIDGWGLILLIIGIALFLLREDIRWVGVVVFLIGFSRILYILNKYGW